MRLLKLHETAIGDGINPSHILIPLESEDGIITVRKIAAWTDNAGVSDMLEIGLGLIPNQYVLMRNVGGTMAGQVIQYDQILQLPPGEVIYAVFDVPAADDICHLMVIADKI